VRATPDLATLELAIEVRDALKAKLATRGTIWTGAYSLVPEYGEPRNRRAMITGFRADNSITVETGDLALVGPSIDVAIGAGANRVDALTYSLQAESKARSEAIAKAAHDAQMQARALAAGLEVKLGPVLQASTESEVRPIPVARFATAGEIALSAQTPIMPGQITVPATVSLTYGIE